MFRRVRSLVLLVVLVMAAALVPGASAHKPVIAHAAGTCKYGNSRSYGYSYLTWLWVYKTSCGTGVYVAKHHGHVKGWSCSKKILDKSPVQYDAQITCHSGHRQVSWKYTQNT